MSIEMTIAFVRAETQRAEHHGQKNVQLNVKDVLEILAKVESNVHHERAAKPMKRAGWVSPGAMRAMCGSKKGKRGIRLMRFKTEEFNTEVFFCDNLREKFEESVAAMAAKEAAKAAEQKAAEAKGVAGEL